MFFWSFLFICDAHFFFIRLFTFLAVYLYFVICLPSFNHVLFQIEQTTPHQTRWTRNGHSNNSKKYFFVSVSTSFMHIISIWCYATTTHTHTHTRSAFHRRCSVWPFFRSCVCLFALSHCWYINDWIRVHTNIQYLSVIIFSHSFQSDFIIFLSRPDILCVCVLHASVDLIIY